MKIDTLLSKMRLFKGAVTYDCKHIYVLIFFINNNRSYPITSFKQKWGKPSESLSAEEKYSQPLQIKDDFKAKSKLSPVRISPYKLDLSHFINKKNSPLKTYFEYKHANKNRLFVR